MREIVGAVVRVAVIYDRYRCGEVRISSETYYEDGHVCGDGARRVAMADSVSVMVGRLWPVLFDEVLRMQQQRKQVQIAYDLDSAPAWLASLIETLVYTAAWELKVEVNAADIRQIALFDLVS
jgi:hypothetical protein